MKLKNIALVVLENLYKVVVVLLLTGILIMQALTYFRMPPTFGEFKAVTDPQKRLALSDNVPILRVTIAGEVKIDDTFPVQVEVAR